MQTKIAFRKKSGWCGNFNDVATQHHEVNKVLNRHHPIAAFYPARFGYKPSRHKTLGEAVQSCNKECVAIIDIDGNVFDRFGKINCDFNECFDIEEQWQ